MATLDRLAPPASASAAPAWNPRRAIVAVLLAATTIALLQVVQSSSFTHKGQQLQQLTAQEEQLTAQNHQMEADIAALSSLDRIERAARDRLGMVPAINITYIAVPVAAPSGPPLPEPLAQIVATPPKPDSWWQALLRNLSISFSR